MVNRDIAAVSLFLNRFAIFFNKRKKLMSKADTKSKMEERKMSMVDSMKIDH